MGVSADVLDGLTKDIYDKGQIEKLFNEEPGTLKKMKKSPRSIGGKGLVIPVNLKGNEKGQGSMNELEALREPAYQQIEDFRIKPKVFTHTIRLSGLSMEIAKGDEESFADNFTYQMEEGLKDAMKERNAQLFRDGSGRIAQVNGAVVNTDTITFDNGVPTHFRRGIFVDIINGGNVKQVNNVEIVDVDIANNQIVLASNQNCDDDSFIYRNKVADNAPTDGKELAGFKLLVDDGTLSATYQGLSRVTFPQVDGITINAGGANLSNDLLQRAISRVKTISNGKLPKKVVSNTQQFRKYLDVVVPLKRFQGKEKMDSGYEEVPTWNGMEWIEDTDCDFDRVYLWEPSYYERYVTYDLKFDDTDGKIVKWDSGYDAFICYAKAYDNLGSRVPNAHVAISNLAVPTF